MMRGGHYGQIWTEDLTTGAAVGRGLGQPGLSPISRQWKTRGVDLGGNKSRVGNRPSARPNRARQFGSTPGTESRRPPSSVRRSEPGWVVIAVTPPIAVGFIVKKIFP